MATTEQQTAGTVSVEDAPTSRYRKVSITLPEPLLERVRERVGQGGLSNFAARALEHEERRLALDEWLADMEAEHGPVPPEVMEEVRRVRPAQPTAE